MPDGCVVILNGAPRSGKTSIAAVLVGQGWLNLGVDSSMSQTPEHLLPGIGLRPGGERPDLEADVVRLYGELYDEVATQARAGRNVVVDVGHHEAYSQPLGILDDCMRRLAGIPTLFVGVRCSSDEIWRRRAETWGQHREEAADDLLAAVDRWETHVHRHDYDFEVDTSVSTPDECAALILALL